MVTMTKRKQKFCLGDMPIFSRRQSFKEKAYRPDSFFQSHNRVAEALLACLEDNDVDAYLEILDAYLQINRSRIARKAKISRTTIQNALSKKGNPTIRTIAKIVHTATAA